MGAPSTVQATLRPELGAGLVQFDLAMDRAGFIAQRVLPVLDVGASAGPFGKIPLEQLLKGGDTTRTNKGGYNRGEWTFDKDTFSTEENGWEERVDERESNLYREFFDHEQISAARALDVVLREYEKRVAALVFNATTWTGTALTTAVQNEWSDLSNATPIADVEAAVKWVYANSGLWPNALIINRKVFRNLRNCDEVIERIQSAGAGFPTRAADITAAQLAAVFDLDYILVGGSTKNAAKEGQTRSLSQIWSDEYAMVCRIATSQDPKEPCLGRTLHWSVDGSQIGGTVESYEEVQTRGEIIRVRHDTDEKILYPQCGHLLSNITE